MVDKMGFPDVLKLGTNSIIKDAIRKPEQKKDARKRCNKRCIKKEAKKYMQKKEAKNKMPKRDAKKRDAKNMQKICKKKSHAIESMHQKRSRNGTKLTLSHRDRKVRGNREMYQM